MMSRIFPALLIASVLAILTACSGNIARQDVDLSSQQGDEDEVDRGDFDPLEQRRQYPAGRSLAEIAAFSAGLTSYQPDLALEILRSLESRPSGQLKVLIDQQYLDPGFTEWLELAVQIRAAAISESSSSIAAGEWADSHFGHVVSKRYFSELVDSYRALFPIPSRVAVLLPTEGRLSAAARAIRDGIMSAYLDRPGDSVIRFYSSGQSVEAAIAAYARAVEDGAIQVIGPLHIDSTRTIANLAGVATPVLLLNAGANGDTGQAGIINSLSLSTTEEAAAIAARALAQGQRRVIMMVPDNAWGERIEFAFQQAFEQGGGQIRASTRYNDAESDHSATLTRLLKIDASKQRKTDLQSWLGVALTFEPSRRSDFDFIFLAANPVEGRELKPLLRFHDAGDVPVFAMGRIYSGRLQRASDQDLNDIVFPTTRWQLGAVSDPIVTLESTELASVRGGASGNLFALGQDAWRLLPWLPLMRKDPDLWFPGAVGSLRLQTDGSLYREPVWAQFSAGQPTAFQWPHIDDESSNQ